MNKGPGIETIAGRKATILSVGPIDEDGDSLERIFHESVWSMCTNPEWTMLALPTLGSALRVLRETIVPIVICEADLLPGTWRKMLEQISLLSDPPLLIVSSRFADERLWAEVLDLGAYDLLAKPFDATEVIRIISSACLHWQERHELHAHRTRQRKAAIAA